MPPVLREVTVDELTFSMAPDVAGALRSGELDPDVAYMQGKLKVAGDMARFFDALPLAGWVGFQEALDLHTV